MDELATFTTANFRDNKPKSVWVVDTWRALHQLKYKKLSGKIMELIYSEVLKNILVRKGITTEKELYYEIMKVKNALSEGQIRVPLREGQNARAGFD